MKKKWKRIELCNAHYEEGEKKALTWTGRSRVFGFDLVCFIGEVWTCDVETRVFGHRQQNPRAKWNDDRIQYNTHSFNSY
jgi:hypothetical protein